jgi:hypothetical protein
MQGKTSLIPAKARYDEVSCDCLELTRFRGQFVVWI